MQKLLATVGCLTLVGIAAADAEVTEPSVGPRADESVFADEVTAEKPVIADTVVYGTIRTAETNNPVAEAIAVKDGKYVYVGDESGAAAWVGGTTKVVDHRGRGMVMPGCTDGHSHYTLAFCLANMKGGVLFSLDDDKDTVLEKVRNAASKAKVGGKKSLFGFGWDLLALRVNAKLTLDELDAATYGVSTVIVDSIGHSAYCNSECLKRCGVIDDAGKALIKEIPGGILELDENERPTGYVDERVVGYMSRMGGIDADELIDDEVAEVALSEVLELLLSTGYTTVLDGWSNNLHPRKLYEAARRMDDKGDLKLIFPMTYEVEPWQTNMTEQIEYLAALNAMYGTRHVRPEYLKLFMDGCVESKTGANSKPYKDGTVYKSFWPTDRLVDITTNCNDKGLTVHIHVMGDAAVKEVTDAYVTANKLRPDNTNRNCLVHLRNVCKEDFRRFADNNIACTAGLHWHSANMKEVEEEMKTFLEDEYVDHSYPIKSFFDAGVKVSSHTDYPANDDCPQDPFGIMYVAVTGLDPKHGGLFQPFDTNELITVEQAFQALTLNGAWQMGLENERGSIKVGKWADFVLADRDVFTCAKTDIAKTKVVSTWFEGEMVYQVPPSGSEDNPWEVGTDGHEAEVTAWTNGTGTLVVEGAGAVGRSLWTEFADGITKLQFAEGVTNLGKTMATLPSLTSVNGLTFDKLVEAGMVGAAKAGFSAVAVDNGVAHLGVVVSTNGDLTAVAEVKEKGEGEGWGKAKVKGATVVDGEAILTIPATADKGFMILESKGR